MNTAKRRRPDFLGIGAQKAGTTWLWRQFQGHPGIWMPPEKELHFFDERLEGSQSLRDKLTGSHPRDERWRRQLQRQAQQRSLRSLPWAVRYFLGRPGEQWYASLFAAGGDRVTGEITPDYSTLSPLQVETVLRVNPSMRLILLIRNPVERAWSHAAMHLARGDSQDIDSASPRLREQLEGRRSRRLGDYLQTIETWTAYFPPEQLFVGFLEDVDRHPRKLLNRLCAHIGAPAPRQYQGVRRRVHSGSIDTMPLWAAQHLARLYLDSVADLDRRYGGYASWWHYCLRRLLDDPPDEPRVAHPFFSGPLWDDWVAETGQPAVLTGPQSAALPALAGQP